MTVKQSYSLIHSNLYFLATGKKKKNRKSDEIVLLRLQNRPFLIVDVLACHIKKSMDVTNNIKIAS